MSRRCLSWTPGTFASRRAHSLEGFSGGAAYNDRQSDHFVKLSSGIIPLLLLILTLESAVV